MVQPRCDLMWSRCDLTLPLPSLASCIAAVGLSLPLGLLGVLGLLLDNLAEELRSMRKCQHGHTFATWHTLSSLRALDVMGCNNHKSMLGRIRGGLRGPATSIRVSKPIATTHVANRNAHSWFWEIVGTTYHASHQKLKLCPHWHIEF
jgi:hypothetical protein